MNLVLIRLFALYLTLKSNFSQATANSAWYVRIFITRESRHVYERCFV